MASTQKRSVATPPLLPWIPPGKIDDTFNLYATKKNSKLELDLGKSKPGSELRKDSVFKKNSKAKDKEDSAMDKEAKELAEAEKAEEERKRLKDQIKELFDEEEEERKKKEEEERKKNQEEEDDSKDNKKDKKRSKSEEDRYRSSSVDSRSRKSDKGKRRSRSEERSRSRDNRHRSDSRNGSRRGRSSSRDSRGRRRRSHSRDEGYDDDGGGSRGARNRRYGKRDSRAGGHSKHRRSSDSANTNTSGIDSLVEDIEDEDRHSVDFIDDSGDYNQHQRGGSRNQFQRGYRPGGGHGNGSNFGGNNGRYSQQYGPQYGPGGPQGQYGGGWNSQQEFGIPFGGPGGNGVWLGNGPQAHHIYFQQEQQQLPPQHTYIHLQDQQTPQSLPVNLHVVNSDGSYAPPSPSFTNVNLVQGGKQRPEAWILINKENKGQNGRSSITAKPINFASSIGSLLKESFTNINSARTAPMETMQAAPVVMASAGDGYGDGGQDDVAKVKVTLEERKSRATKAGCATGLAMAVILAVVLISVIAATNNGNSSSAQQSGNGGTIYVGSGVGPCSNYRILSDSWRKLQPSGASTPTLNCDDHLVPAWYRFQEPGGTFMSTTDPTASINVIGQGARVCGTDRVGYLSGGDHPTVLQGQVQRKICFRWTTGPCQFSFDTNVTTCNDPVSGGTFYLYFLKPFDSGCYYGFCAV